jgi:hypothetical protein
MAILGMFKSAEERESEMKGRLRQAVSRIEGFVRRLQIQSKQYVTIAKRAFELGDLEQFRELATQHLAALDAINRWQRYQLKLNTMEMRREEVKATKEFLSGMGALTQSILNGVSPAEIGRVTQDMESAKLKCEELEQTLYSSMNDAIGMVNGATVDDEFLMQAVGVLEPKKQSESMYSGSSTKSASRSDANFEAAVDSLRDPAKLTSFSGHGRGQT